MQEVQDKTIRFHQSQIILALDHGVYKSDTLFHSSLKSALQASLRRLERAGKVDKTSGSDKIESTIVDPSLHPLCFGKTKHLRSASSKLDNCIKLCGKGTSRNSLRPGEDGSLKARHCYAINNAWSVRYQWLPCDVSFEPETGTGAVSTLSNPINKGVVNI